MNILMASDGAVKLADQMFINSNKTGYIKALQGDQAYFSPQSIHAFARRETSPLYNPYKNDVYTAAISVLEACTFASGLDLFDVSQGVINNSLLQQLLTQARLTYSNFLCNTLQEMLNEDENQRVSFSELNTVLSPYHHMIVNLEPFVIGEQNTNQIQYVPQQSNIAQSIIINPNQQPPVKQIQQ